MHQVVRLSGKMGVEVRRPKKEPQHHTENKA